MYYPLFCGTYFVNSVSGIRNDIKEKGGGEGRKGRRVRWREEGRGERGEGRGRRKEGKGRDYC